MAILYQTLIWLRWPWNTGLRCAPPMVILRGFAGCVGLIPSRPKHEECRHLILVHLLDEQLALVEPDFLDLTRRAAEQETPNG